MRSQGRALGFALFVIDEAGRVVRKIGEQETGIVMHGGALKEVVFHTTIDIPIYVRLSGSRSRPWHFGLVRTAERDRKQWLRFAPYPF